MKRLRYFLVATAMVFLAASVAGAYPFAPDEDFKTLHTEHFRISYPAQYRFVALKVAVLAEEAFTLITKTLKYEQPTPTDIFITDRVDGANGYSSVTPVQVMRLFLAPPHTADRLDFADDWLRMLVYHEMTHQVQTDEVRGFWKGMRYVFGRTLPVTHFQPQGLVEGIALLHETELTTKGRNRSPYSRMLLRMAALEKSWPPLDRLTLTPHDWPGGAVPYIWGGAFHQYLFERYGMDKIADYYLKHAGQVWPFWWERNARKIFGTHLNDIYKTWSVNMVAEFEHEAAALRDQGLTQGTRLTDEGNVHQWPTWLDAHRIVFYTSDRDRVTGLRAIDLRNKKPRPRRLAATQAVRGVTRSADGRVVFAQSQPRDRYRVFFDLWSLDPAKGKKRLTKSARVADPAWIPGTRRVLAITQDGGRTAPAIVDLDTGEVQPLFPFDRYEGVAQFAGVAMHPSGEWAATSVWHDDGNRDVFRLDIASGEFTRLTSHPMRDIDPAFDPSGRYLVFTSGRTGVYNLFALDLQTDELFQITNVLGGAFMPAVSPDGKHLVYSGYTAGGFDLYLMDFDPRQWTAVAREEISSKTIVVGPITQDIRERAAALDPPTDDYRAYRTAWPHYWLPSFSFGSEDLWLGAKTAGFDIAGYHSWALEALWGFERRFPYAAASYTYSRFTPSFQFVAAHSAERHSKIVTDEDGDPEHYWERRVSGLATLIYPLFWKHAFYGGYVGQSRTDLDDLPDQSPTPAFTGYWSGARLGWTYDAAPSDRYVSVPLGLGGTVHDGLFGSNVNQQFIGGTAGIRVPLGVSDLRLAAVSNGALSFGDLLPQRSFRLGGYAQNSPLTLNYESDRFQVRGYDAGTAAGDRIANGTLELAFPVARIERGIKAWPIYFRDISGMAFGEGGVAVDRDEEVKEEDLLPSAGMELYFDFTFAYSFAARLRFAAAYGFRDPEEHGGYKWFVALTGLIPQ
ncbi:MAG: hypothetical protein P9L99_01290 [Candidatus Lernaella stagnicola]|nr:hypothetical protein [Candidatus Lernaella stagnicola]